MQPAERRWDHWSQPFLSFTQALSSPSAVLTINQMGFGWTQQNCTFLPVHQHIRQWDGQAVLHPSVTCYSSLDLKKTWILVLSGIHCSSIIIVSDPQKLNADHSNVKLPFNTRDWLEIRLQVTCITCNCFYALYNAWYSSFCQQFFLHFFTTLFMPFTTHDATSLLACSWVRSPVLQLQLPGQAVPVHVLQIKHVCPTLMRWNFIFRLSPRLFNLGAEPLLPLTLVRTPYFRASTLCD